MEFPRHEFIEQARRCGVAPNKRLAFANEQVLSSHANWPFACLALRS